MPAGAQPFSVSSLQLCATGSRAASHDCCCCLHRYCDFLFAVMGMSSQQLLGAFPRPSHSAVGATRNAIGSGSKGSRKHKGKPEAQQLYDSLRASSSAAVSTCVAEQLDDMHAASYRVSGAAVVLVDTSVLSHSFSVLRHSQLLIRISTGACQSQSIVSQVAPASAQFTSIAGLLTCTVLQLRHCPAPPCTTACCCTGRAGHAVQAAGPGLCLAGHGGGPGGAAAQACGCI